MKNENIIIGKVSSSHGISGEIMIYPLTDDITRFDDLKYFICGDEEYTIVNLRIHKGQVLVLTEQINDRNKADLLRGRYIEVRREDALPLSEGQYYIEDLKGLKAVDINSGRTGILKDIIQPGSVDIFLIQTEGKEMMMPFFNSDVEEINLEEGYIRLDMSKLI